MSFFNVFKVLTAPIVWLVFPLKVVGKQNFPKKQPVVLCCNHYSGLDIALIANRFLWGHCRCIAKEELFHSRFVAWFLRKCGAISIRRGESDIAAFRAANEVLQQGEPLVIFPEGTRNADPQGDLQPLQAGAVTFAVRNGCPIVPMMFLRKVRPFRRTVLVVGQPIDTAPFAAMHPKEARTQATALLDDTMRALHAELRASGGKGTKHLPQ